LANLVLFTNVVLFLSQTIEWNAQPWYEELTVQVV